MVDKEKVKSLMRELIIAIGDNPDREGLKETPMRVANMYEEIFSGIDSNPKEHLKVFSEESNYGNVISVKDIPFYSICEHHFLPFFGYVNITYIPGNEKIIGLSKFSRIVECFARRPQVQERLTSEIAEFIFNELKPNGILVEIEAEHMCMTMRGVRAIGSRTKTTSIKGNIRTRIMKSDY